MPNLRFGSFRALWKSVALTAVLCATSCLPVSAQVFTKLVDFSPGDDPEPYEMQLVQDRSGNLWGTSAAYFGTVFRMTTAGELTTIYGFGAYDLTVYGGLLGTDGNFYGITQSGGANALGNFYKVAPDGTYTNLHDFDFISGQYPIGQVIQGPDGYFYGTTLSGGNSGNCAHYGCGVVYKISAAGDYKVIYNFDGIHGEEPFGGVMFASNGNFYGTTLSGIGPANYGTVFSLSSTGKISVIHTFTFGMGGATPWAAPVEGPDGNFYGTTAAGGIDEAGIVYKITPTGVFTNLHTFDFRGDGGNPLSGLTLGTDGNFYGTSWANGNAPDCAPPCGTIYKITSGGVFSLLHTFVGSDGSGLQVPVTQHTDGKFYGTASFGGTNGEGTAYSLDMGLGPFLHLQNSIGGAGSVVYILGTGLAGTSAITFNGVAAKFVLSSDTLVVATVPAGATSGPVHATTPNGVLVSNTNFLVK
jgi:uncharacterized repeat protein (TIGR03803 family)